MPDPDKPTAVGDLVVTFKIHKRKKRGRTVLREGGKSEKKTGALPGIRSGRIPRISRLMALAIHLQKLVDDGVVRDYAEIARLTGLTRARITQIMNLNLLAPEIQEEILFLPHVMNGRDSITEHDIRPIATTPLWSKQVAQWEDLATRAD